MLQRLCFSAANTPADIGSAWKDATSQNIVSTKFTDSPEWSEKIHTRFHSKGHVVASVDDFIIACLCANAIERPTIAQLLASAYISGNGDANNAKAWLKTSEASLLRAGNAVFTFYDDESSQDRSDDSINLKAKDKHREKNKFEPAADTNRLLNKLTLQTKLHLWQLIGGNIETLFAKGGQLLQNSPILRLPGAFSAGQPDASTRKGLPVTLFSDETVPLSLGSLHATLRQRFDERSSEIFEWRNDHFTAARQDIFTFGSGADLYDDVFNSTNLPHLFALPHVQLDAPLLLQKTEKAGAKSRPASPTEVSIDPETNSNLVNSVEHREILSAFDALAKIQQSARVPKLTIAMRESDAVYQAARSLYFADLLPQFPVSFADIVNQASIDIPPLYRGQVWAAILGVYGDYRGAYEAIDKYSETPADRQFDLDIPRCHQYNTLLASPIGHAKFRRILKAWVRSNPHLVYWQGLDSLTAPFLTLNFHDEALAFASLQAFVRRFLHNFFLPDNSAIVQKYLAIFTHLLSYHDPELSTHFHRISYTPELYAIPWFLTVYTREC